MSDLATAPSEPAPRRPFARFLLLLASLCAGGLVCEVAVRLWAARSNARTLERGLRQIRAPVSDPDAGLGNIVRLSQNDRIVYELQPELVDRTYRRSLVSTDAHGFRVGPPVPEDERPLRTIVGLGDSIMFGDGVDDRFTYLHRLQEILQERLDEYRWRVVNTAVPGYNTVMEVETLREKALAFEPDLVILHLVDNDYAPPRFVQAEVDPWSLDRSFALDRIRGRDTHFADPEQAVVQGGEWYENDASGKAVVPERYRHVFGREAFARALRDLAELSAEHGFEVITFTSYNWGRTEEMVQTAVEHGFRHLDMMPVLEQWMREVHGVPFTPEAYVRSPLVVGRRNAHPSARQHDLIAYFLAREIGRHPHVRRMRAQAGR